MYEKVLLCLAVFIFYIFFLVFYEANFIINSYIIMLFIIADYFLNHNYLLKRNSILINLFVSLSKKFEVKNE